ncbi:tail fiber domain-containing protein [Caballeronia sp. LZ035]|uniref:tail fiber domain-containing protein n=1 Tax=Caballeronia sp. LZ035 TaxID=3038568 RepID=UPI00286602B3|nr:tail fiber domain-containing protein [Caballeronia sp. LZ035]MDR5761961.1 tail fiber domain-containing protein [Caballeronia sp. LZ035]
MATLQKVNLGTPPTAVDGDTSRVANTKVNANVDVLAKQATLTSIAPLTAVRALTAADVGQRVTFSFTGAQTVPLPQASTCAADQILLLRNAGAAAVTLSKATGSSDTIGLSKLNPGETALLDTDGTSKWSVLMRGRSNSDNESVNGILTASGGITANGVVISAYASPIVYLNDTSASGFADVRFQSNGTTRWSLQKSTANNFNFSRFDATGAFLDNPLSFAAATGVGAFTQRPTFAGNTAWDSGNLTPANYMPKTGGTFTGAVTFPQSTAAGGLLIGTGGVLYLYDGGSGSIAMRTGGVSKFFTFDAVGNGNAVNGSWINGSDARLKSEIVEIDSPLDRILALRGVFYELKSNPGVRQVGVIAQEVQAQFPEVVSAMGGEDDYLGVSYGNLVGPLIEAVKELSSKLDAANKRIDKLEGGAS